MKIAIALAVAGLGTVGALWRQDPLSPVPDEERTRFLFHGVFEGLVEDGAPAEIVERILAHRDAWFVPKCPICHSVHAALRAFASYARDNGWKSPRKDGLPPWFGVGFPKETVEALKSEDTKTRHGAFEKLVHRYVERRFARVRMSREDIDKMRDALKLGMKEGLEMLKSSGREELFPASCPSCEGAN